ncbi:MAG: amino acid ABC transporter substrate-binding protein [Pseudomonadota bacterium]
MKPLFVAVLLGLCGIATTEQANAQTLDRLRETGKIVLAHRVDARPMSYVNDEGNPAGYTPAVCVAIAKAISAIYDMELTAEFIAVDTSTRFDTIINGEADLLCGAATITLSRRELVDFSIPVFVDGASVAVRKGGDPDPANFDGKTVGIRSNTTTEDALQTTMNRLGAEPRIERFASHKDGIAALLNSEIDAYLADQSILVFEILASGEKERLSVASRPLTLEKQGLALARGDAEFRLAVDRAISRLYISGGMREIFDRAFPGTTPGRGMEALYGLAAEPE